MLPLEGAALAYINTFLPWTDWFTITLVLLLTVFQILFHPYAIVIFHALLRLFVNVFADLMIYNAESTQLVYNSGQKLLVCDFWYWVELLVCPLLRNAGKSGGEWPILPKVNIGFSSCMASFHQGNTEFYCPDWEGDLVYNVFFCH